jgi:basic membrane protein A and related proteins
MKRALVILFTVVMIAGLMLTGAGCKSNDPKSFKVGFIYIGSVGDLGFTFAQDQGRKYLESNLNVTTIAIENVPESADCKTAMENLIKQGCKVIFATSFGYQDYCDELAKKYPKVIFEHCSGSKSNDTNFGTYFGRMYQARYLTGIAAGKATKTGKIGYVAAFPIPEVVRMIDAFTLGVRSVNPTATVNVVWTNTWYDPTIEKQAADSLIQTAGCDVMAQHQDSTAAVQAAEAAGIFSTGYNSPMLSAAPKGYLTSPVWNWGPYFAKVVKAAMDGTYKPEKYWGGLETGTIDVDQNYGPSVTQETKDAIKAAKDKMIGGSWDVFTGPIKAQDGSDLVADGQKLTDDQIWNLLKFVDGVVGTIPQS